MGLAIEELKGLSDEMVQLTGFDMSYLEVEEDDFNADEEYEKIKDALPHLEKAGFYEKFTIDLMYIDKPFGTAVIDEVSSRYNVRKNKIFIGSIHRSHRFDYGDLGGVRVIF